MRCRPSFEEKNITELYVYRLRNNKDLESLIDELSALYDKKTLLELYNMATNEPHSFLYINLVAKDKKDMFMMNLDRKLVVEDPKWKLSFIKELLERLFKKVLSHLL